MSWACSGGGREMVAATATIGSVVMMVVARWRGGGCNECGLV